MNKFLSFFTTNTSFPKRAGFEDILFAITQPTCLLINTLPSHEQDYLIQQTIPYFEEETIINDILEANKQSTFSMILYGRNNVDDTMEKRYHQIRQLGFSNVWIYYGGLFEYALLQELFGIDMFPSIGTCRNILTYKPCPQMTTLSNRCLLGR